MIKSKLTYLQMADVLDKTADAMEEMLEGGDKSCVNWVDMGYGGVGTKNDHLNCGTPACVGGWLTLLSGEKYGNSSSAYVVGAEWFARKLGFLNYACLAIFFQQRPKLWGNEFGGVMFDSSLAYFPTADDLLFSMRSVTNHWREVAKRMRQASRSKKLQLPNVYVPKKVNVVV